MPGVPQPEKLNYREKQIMKILSSGEASTKAVCIGIGCLFPADLEKVRHGLKYLERRGLVVKAIRPTRNTRHAYYALVETPTDTGSVT